MADSLPRRPRPIHPVYRVRSSEATPAYYECRQQLYAKQVQPLEVFLRPHKTGRPDLGSFTRQVVVLK